jgi:hypothetical protein
MLEALRKFFQSKAGVATAGILVVIGLVAAVYAFKASFGESDVEYAARVRMFMDASTNPPTPFKHSIDGGESVPVKAPSGQMTGYPAEACYWTKDGNSKTSPTWVLLNAWKQSKEPTFCPDCGRLVVSHNPAPEPERKPPPTKAEHDARRAAPVR